MTGWQRPVRAGIGLFTLVFGVGVFVAVRDRPSAEVSPAVERIDPEAIVESTGAVVTQAKGDERDFMLHAERQLTYADGATRLEIVTILVDMHENRDFTVSSRQAEVGKNEEVVTLIGDVRLKATDGLEATTARATYDDREGLVTAPEYIEFVRRRLSGSGVGGTYDRDRDLLTLLDDAHVTLGAGTGGGADVTADRATLARSDHYMRFEGHVRITQRGQLTTAHSALAFFAEDTGRVEMVELRGDVRVTGGSSGVGSMRGMGARDMNLTYGEPDGVLRHATLAGNATMVLAGEPGRSDRHIAGEWIDMEIGPDGSTVAALSVRENVRVEFPSDMDGPAREVRAASMEATGEPGQGLTEAHFTDDVEYRETQPATSTTEALERVTRADTLDTSLSPGLGTLTEARFRGHVMFRDGRVTATGSQARYDVGAGIITLTPTDTAPDAPRVVDAHSSVEAASIALAVDGSTMSATGDVRSVLTPVSDDAEGDDGARMPGILTADAQAFVTSTDLQYDAETGLAVYTGDAQLWQGETAVKGDRLALDQRTADLTATGSARSTFMLEKFNEVTKEPEQVMTIARGATFHYEDAERRVTYTTDAHVDGPLGDLTATRIELYLGEEHGRLDRVQGYERVKLRLTDRTATGMRMTYYTADGRYVMNGAPVQILEELPSECRETLGRTLTFFRSTDTISVDGNEQVRTESKTIGQCPAPQFH